MSRRALGPVSAILFAALLAPPLAAGEQTFEATIRTSASAIVSGAESLQAEGIMLATRIYEGRPAMQYVELAGTIGDATIYRYENQWVFVQNPIRPSSYQTGDPSPILVDRGAFDLEYLSSGAEAAVVLVADELRGGVGNTFTSVETVATNPYTVSVAGSSKMPTYGPHSGTNETKGWLQKGRYVVMQPGALDADVSGKIRLYWFAGSVAVEGSSGRQVLESRVWEEQPVDGSDVRIRNFVWYEIHANISTLRIATAASDRLIQTHLFVTNATFTAVDEFAVDSASQVNGTIPSTASTEGSSLWVFGDMDVTLRPNGADEFEGRGYRLDVAGKAKAYAYGGNTPLRFVGRPETAAVGILAFVAVAAYLFRDTLAKIVGNLLFPMYSRLDADRLLEHKTRDAICRAVRATPGVSFMALRVAVSGGPGQKLIGLGTFSHHVQRLVRAGLVSAKQAGRFRRFYAPEDARQMSSARLEFMPAASQQIARLVLERGDIAQMALFQEVLRLRAMSDSTFRHHLKKLVAEDLVAVRWDGRRNLVAATHLLRSAVFSGASTGSAGIVENANGVALGA